ncbi:EP23 [Urbanus proteus nucleopolyhedrovirus]|uniref:EP23 n=1 Tax=Urbanus proteus nucleopolyhedrovirus TaxID=1675866 RepID=A0A162GUF8_9ABAC|nr:EP23 [Urbanus proteus nucleopolyhedrovirus]AKR17338.1 EP23 [Urbanus proteus nucleopolyhedrovirus]
MSISLLFTQNNNNLVIFKFITNSNSLEYFYFNKCEQPIALETATKLVSGLELNAKRKIHMQLFIDDSSANENDWIISCIRLPFVSISLLKNDVCSQIIFVHHERECQIWHVLNVTKNRESKRTKNINGITILCDERMQNLHINKEIICIRGNVPHKFIAHLFKNDNKTLLQNVDNVMLIVKMDMPSVHINSNLCKIRMNQLQQ